MAAEPQRRNVGVRSGSALGVHSDAFSAQRKHTEGRLSDLCAALTHFQPPIYHHGNLARSARSLSQVSGHRDGFTSARFPFTPPWERLSSLSGECGWAGTVLADTGASLATQRTASPTNSSLYRSPEGQGVLHPHVLEEETGNSPSRAGHALEITGPIPAAVGFHPTRFLLLCLRSSPVSGPRPRGSRPKEAA